MIYWTEIFGTTCIQIQHLTDTRMAGDDRVWTPWAQLGDGGGTVLLYCVLFLNYWRVEQRYDES